MNSAYRDYYRDIAGQLTPSTPYVDIARAYLTVFPEYGNGLPLAEAVQNWVAAAPSARTRRNTSWVIAGCCCRIV